MTTLTFDEIKQEIRRLAVERPDFVYSSAAFLAEEYGIDWEDDAPTSCFYQHGEGIPGCIFGHVFLNLDIPVPPEYEGEGIDSLLSWKLHVGLTPSQGEWLTIIQTQQDQGMPWGKCVAMADATVPTV